MIMDALAGQAHIVLVVAITPVNDPHTILQLSE